MKRKGKRSLILFVVLVVVGLAVPQRSEAFIFINEILADPASGLAGDANNDGTRHSFADEFIEIRNSGINSVNISGWSLADAVSTRHVFLQDTFLNPNAYIVVFGGGLPNLQVDWQIASSGFLGLNNGGDTVSLFGLQGQTIDEFIYGSLAGNNESIVRFPEEPGNDFVRHSSVSNSNALFSPGTSTNPITETHRNTVPEPTTLMTFLLAGAGWMMKKRWA